MNLFAGSYFRQADVALRFVFISTQPKKQRLNYGWLSSSSSAFPDINVSPPMLRTRGGRNRNNVTSAAAAGNGKQASEVSAKDFSSVVMEQFTRNCKSVRVHATQATSCFPSQIQIYFIPHS